jgi:RNA methyltransferase, TrmH family
MEEIIVSTANPRIKNVLKLKEKTSERKVQGVMVVEGEREIRSAIRNGWVVKTLFVCESIFHKKNKDLLQGINHLVKVSREVFEKIAYRENSDGLLALIFPKQLRLHDLQLSANPLLVILEAVEKPGNLGAVLRTADGAGADAVIVCDPKTDIYNPNVIRSAIGCIFSKQVVIASTDEVLLFLKEKNIKPYSAALSGKVHYTSANFNKPCAIVLGTEADGLSQKWLLEGEPIKIPMLGQVDSLNVSASCAVMLYEAVRQRTKG